MSLYIFMEKTNKKYVQIQKYVYIDNLSKRTIETILNDRIAT